MTDISRMVGLTPVHIKQGEEEISFEFDNGSKAVFYHGQDCCETVVVDDVNGDWDDLIGTPLLVADERVSEDFDGEPKSGFRDDSETWTFYTFRSVRGSVDVRWHGTSNGYYSESVDFTFIDA